MTRLIQADGQAATMIGVNLGGRRARAVKGLNDFVYVTVNTCIGGAAVVDGRLLRGVEGLTGGVGLIAALTFDL